MNTLCTPASELRPGLTFDLFQSFCTISLVLPYQDDSMTVQFVLDIGETDPPNIGVLIVPKNFEFNIHSS